jgi:hypothetical protein
MTCELTFILRFHVHTTSLSVGLTLRRPVHRISGVVAVVSGMVVVVVMAGLGVGAGVAGTSVRHV